MNTTHARSPAVAMRAPANAVQRAGLPLLPDAPVLALPSVWGCWVAWCSPLWGLQPTGALRYCEGIPMLPRVSWVLLVADAAACSPLCQHSQLTAPQLLHQCTRQQLTCLAVLSRPSATGRKKPVEPAAGRTAGHISTSRFQNRLCMAGFLAPVPLSRV